MPKFCPTCGKPLQFENAEICPNCGVRIKGPEQSQPTKKHSTFAKIWMGLMLIGSIITVFVYLISGNQIARTAHIPSFIIPILILIGIGMMVLLIFLYKWKKWAFYGLCGIALITLLINISIGAGVTSFFGLIGIGILYLSISSEWNLYE